MNKIIRKIYFSLPRFIKRWLLCCYENFYYLKLKNKFVSSDYLNRNRIKNEKIKVLFYHILGMDHGGTAKHLQILSKYLDKDKYDVYLMYSEKKIAVGGTGSSAEERKKYLENSGVNFIKFDYSDVESSYPYVINQMSPSFFDVIKENNIDIIITTGAGYSYFPFNLVRDIPIIMLNCFGSYIYQKNVKYNISYTKDLLPRLNEISLPEITKAIYIPIEKPVESSVDLAKQIRENFDIKKDDVVFGRIGRDVDTIFDPIGIRAFQQVVKDYPEAHYLIMSPPPILKKIVSEENIPNVHFLPPSSNEEKIWAFHQACDVCGHFRHDGETFGVNIAEAMMCGKPVLTHVSFMWNAHLDYLESSFSRIAKQDDIGEYAQYMIEFINKKKSGELLKMGQLAREKAEKVFSPKKIVEEFDKLINLSLK